MCSAKSNYLIIADSERSSNMLYASGFSAPDPFIFTRINAKTFLLASPLEYERAKKESKADTVVNTADINVRYKPRSFAGIFLSFLKGISKARSFEVPADFPLVYADFLKKRSIKLKIKTPPFFPERMIKSSKETTYIKKSVAIAQKGMKAGEDILKKSSINNRGYIVYNNRVLTSEFLKSEINVAMARENGICTGTIVAGGDQACDPHCRGTGKLKAYQPIIFDIFPRSNETFYHADITRTFIKGKPSSELKKLYNAVKDAQEKAISMIKPGVCMGTVHNSVADHFKKQGYETEVKGDQLKGFIHSTGHGFGLDIHEHPGISGRNKSRFRKGLVVTVEPGLYYPGLGGVRIEDDVAVTGKGCTILSTYHKRWIIP
ncbi:M24 family metallopeptidase [Planctomycetota bacterium]